jgi:hypothetical protein
MVWQAIFPRAAAASSGTPVWGLTWPGAEIARSGSLGRLRADVPAVSRPVVIAAEAVRRAAVFACRAAGQRRR